MSPSPETSAPELRRGTTSAATARMVGSDAFTVASGWPSRPGVTRRPRAEPVTVTSTPSTSRWMRPRVDGRPSSSARSASGAHCWSTWSSPGPSSIQRLPHRISSMITGSRPRPASVSWYWTPFDRRGASLRSTSPSATSSVRRRVRSEGLIPSSEACRSWKVRSPSRSSRTTSSVQRSPTWSNDRASPQNCR